MPLKESKWVHAQWAGQRATLTLIHLNKEDEGMYTMRVVTKSGYDTYSAYVFVKGWCFHWGGGARKTVCEKQHSGPYANSLGLCPKTFVQKVYTSLH